MHRPKRWAAVLLAVTWPGLGHAYLGMWKRGFAILGSLSVIAFIGAALLPHVGWFWWIAMFASMLWFSGRLLTALDVGVRPIKPRKASLGVVVGRTLLGALLFGALSIGTPILIRAFLIEAFKIPAQSMIPTLVVGDHVFVDKKVRSPARGELVVFAWPEHPEQDFVKRAIAVGGDVIEVDADGVPAINGEKAKRCPVGTYTYWPEGTPGTVDVDIEVETLGSATYLVGLDRHTPTKPFGPYAVPPATFFVLGDNRMNSHDSRVWFEGAGGTVPLANVRGRPCVLWLSASDIGIDYDRFGSMTTLRLPKGAESLQPKLDACLK